MDADRIYRDPAKQAAVGDKVRFETHRSKARATVKKVRPDGKRVIKVRNKVLVKDEKELK